MITIFISSVFLFRLIRKSLSPKLNLPPSPPKLPIIGNLHQLGLLLHRALHQLSEKYGPFMFLQLGYTPALVISSADMLQEIKTNHEIAYLNRPFTKATRMCLYGCINLAFAPYGDYWRSIRKLSVMELLSSKKVQSFRPVREEEVGLMIGLISKAASAGAAVDLSELVLRLTNDIICRCSLGRKYGGEDGMHSFGEMPCKMVKLFTSLSFADLFPILGWMDRFTGLDGRINKIRTELDDFFEQIIDEHLKSKNQHNPDYNEDFVDLLLRVHKEDENFTRDNVKALILDNFVGGTDTAATIIQWLMSELVKNPNEMEKAQEEVRRVVGEKNKVDEEDVSRMEYLRLIVKETLRLHPPVALNVMETAKVTNVRGYDVPAQTKVLVNIWAIQRDPKTWDRPEEFLPERFRDSPLDLKGQDSKYTPFGSGRRGCPGMTFGLRVVEFTIANLLYWFDWQTVGGVELDMTDGFGVTVTRKTPLQLVPKHHFS